MGEELLLPRHADGSPALDHVVGATRTSAFTFSGLGRE